MFQKIKSKALHFAMLAGIGGALVQLVTQVQAALDVHADQADELAPAPVADSAAFAAGYTAGWSDGHEGRTPQVIPEPEGADHD